MNIQTRTADNVYLIELEGRFDAHTAPQIGGTLANVIRDVTSHVIVKLSNVNFVDSTALATLVQSMKQSRSKGGDVLLCDLQQPVRIIFELTRLDKAFTIVDSETQAFAAFG